MTELVRQRQHAAPLARVVHEHVRVDAGDRRGAEGAGRLPRPQRGVDPVALEEAADDVARRRREARERLEDELARVVPADRAADLLEGRRTVVVGQARQAEQPRLQRVVALRDVVAPDDRVDERLGRLVGDLVVEVAGRDPGREAAQAILDCALVEDRVEDVAARPQARTERVCDGFGHPPPLRLLGLPREPRDRLVERLLAAVQRDAELREEVIEEASPRAHARDALLHREPLLGLGEQVRPVAPLRAQDGGVALERLVGEQPLGGLVVHVGPLEVEEEELRVDARVPLPHPLRERAPALVARVGGEAQAGVGLDASRGRPDPLELPHGLVQLGCGELRDPAPVALGEPGRGRCRLVEVFLESLVVRPLVEIREIPLDRLGTRDGRAHWSVPDQ